VEDNLKLIDEFVKKVRVLPLADSIDVYAKEKVRLKNAGKPIEEFDLLIGCAAKAAGLTMVAHNVKHFSHIEDIEIEDWVASQ
jgi:tRNA(fMet)-specific endonuclease VapC